MQRDALLLGEMIDVAEEAIAIASENDRTSLAADRRQHDALLWNFTVLGEASARISREIKESNPDVPWARPVQLRNRIIHGYWSVDLGVLHTTALEQLPAFVEQLRRIWRTLPDHGA